MCNWGDLVETFNIQNVYESIDLLIVISLLWHIVYNTDRLHRDMQKLYENGAKKRFMIENGCKMTLDSVVVGNRVPTSSVMWPDAAGQLRKSYFMNMHFTHRMYTLYAECFVHISLPPVIQISLFSFSFVTKCTSIYNPLKWYRMLIRNWLLRQSFGIISLEVFDGLDRLCYKQNRWQLCTWSVGWFEQALLQTKSMAVVQRLPMLTVLVFHILSKNEIRFNIVFIFHCRFICKSSCCHITNLQWLHRLTYLT